MNLRRITKKDQIEIKKVYFNSIISIDDRIYSIDQKRAWASQAWENNDFNKYIINGSGWLLYDKEKINAFAIRYPVDRIALLYCKGNFQRRGYGTKLIKQLEKDAKIDGIVSLKTEASLISYKLFLKNNWEIIRKEKIIINSKIFDRYKMIKNFY